MEVSIRGCSIKTRSSIDGSWNKISYATVTFEERRFLFWKYKEVIYLNPEKDLETAISAAKILWKNPDYQDVIVQNEFIGDEFWEVETLWRNGRYT